MTEYHFKIIQFYPLRRLLFRQSSFPHPSEKRQIKSIVAFLIFKSIKRNREIKHQSLENLNLTKASKKRFKNGNKIKKKEYWEFLLN